MSVTASGEDTAQLFTRVRRGDRRAREELVERFLPLARKLAYRYQDAGEPFDDLLQVASLGLVKAVDRFDLRRGVAFTTYAVPTIVGEIKRHFRDHSWAVHVPRGTRDQALRVHTTIRELTASGERRPPDRELAERLSLSRAELDDALGALSAFDAVSLDAPTAAGAEPDQPKRSDTLGAVDDSYELAEARVALNAALERIPTRDRRVLQMRFIEDRTQSDIAARIGVSQMQVSRILRRTIERLKIVFDASTAAL